MNYSQYNVEDFVLDENFQQWVKNPDAKSNAFWELWLLQNPEKQHILNEARYILQQHLSILKKDEKRMPQQRVDALWQSIQKETIGIPVQPTKASKNIDRWISKWVRVAAVLTMGLLLSIATWWLYDFYTYTTITTAFGETKTITLPDGSAVVLNAKSKIQFPADWTALKERCVWLDGEAFFKVTKKLNSQHPKFIVHTDDLDVEVMGTQFNVLSREAQTLVTLQEGSINLDIHNTESPEKIVMEPGDQVVFSALSGKATMKSVKAENYSSWTNKLWILDNTSLADVAKRIENIYGKNVTIIDTELYHESITGVLPTENFDQLLEILSTLYGVKIKSNEDQILIYK